MNNASNDEQIMSKTAKSDFKSLSTKTIASTYESSSGQKHMFILSSIFKDRPKTILFN